MGFCYFLLFWLFFLCFFMCMSVCTCVWVCLCVFWGKFGWMVNYLSLKCIYLFFLGLGPEITKSLSVGEGRWAGIWFFFLLLYFFGVFFSKMGWRGLRARRDACRHTLGPITWRIAAISIPLRALFTVTNRTFQLQPAGEILHSIVVVVLTFHVTTKTMPPFVAINCCCPCNATQCQFTPLCNLDLYVIVKLPPRTLLCLEIVFI